MKSETEMMGFTRETTLAINAYCRVLELQWKAVEQGSAPIVKGPIGEAIHQAAEGLKREVIFLRFIRTTGSGATDMDA